MDGAGERKGRSRIVFGVLYNYTQGFELPIKCETNSDSVPTENADMMTSAGKCTPQVVF